MLGETLILLSLVFLSYFFEINKGRFVDNPACHVEIAESEICMKRALALVQTALNSTILFFTNGQSLQLGLDSK